MKVFEQKMPSQSQSVQNNSNNDGGVVGDRHNHFMEFPNELKLGTFLHDKTTLAPIFGSAQSYYGSVTDSFITNNCRTIPKQQEAAHNSENLWDNNSIAYGPDTYLSGGNGQIQMAGKTVSRVWQSTFDPDIVYFTMSYDYNHGYSYNHKWSKSQRKTISFARTDKHINNTTWFYETADYVWGYHNTNYCYSGYPGFCRLNKTSMTISRLGYNNRYSHVQPLYWNNEYLVYVHLWFNYSSGRTSVGHCQVRWDATIWEGTTAYWQEQYPDKQHWAYPFLEVLDQNGDNQRRWIYHNNSYTDGLTQATVQTNRPHWQTVGNVYSSTLVSTHKIIRTYSVKRDVNGKYVFYRTNIPLNDHAFAFTDDSRNQGGKNYGKPTNKYLDIRTCSTTSIGGGVPNELTESNIYGSGGRSYDGSTTHGYKWVNIAFFEASGNGYLIIDMASGTSHNDLDTTAAFVAKITNYTASLKPELTETDSLDLQFIQQVEFGYDCWALYRPEDDAKTFIAMNKEGGASNIYTFNATQEQFQTSSSLNGKYWCIGNTDGGDIYAQTVAKERASTIESLSLSLPYKIEVTPSSERLNYSGATLTPTAKVNAFNHQGDRVSITVNLVIIGAGATFTAGSYGSPTNGGKNLTITTSAGADVTIDLSLTSASLVRITAAMSV